MSDLAWIDFETRSSSDLREVGAYNYAHHSTTEPLILSHAFDGEYGQLWSPTWAWNIGPSQEEYNALHLLFKHIKDGGYVIAWNMFFDRWIWNAVLHKEYDWPYLPPEQCLCAQAQAEGNNLPGSLDKAAEMVGATNKKDKTGKRLISQLSIGPKKTWVNDPETTERMGRFRAYGLRDVHAMRDVWNSCRPLTTQEWDEYHASEIINDRGVEVDAPFALRAAQFAKAEERDLNVELNTLTGDQDMTITNHVRKAKWLYNQLWPCKELQEVTYRGVNKDTGKERYSADRQTREFLLDALANPTYADQFAGVDLDRIIRFLEILEAGNSAAVRKFSAISQHAYKSRIHGQYSFNGAGQTGRFSSRGVQVHNLVRDPVEKGNANRALDAIDDIMQGASADRLVDRYSYPVSRLLARLVRPTFVAASGKTLVWGDWDQIEARILPWLADSSGGDAKLEVFTSDRDVYTVAASEIFNVDYDDVTPEIRQAGKVLELACGFGGWVGAVKSMGRNFGLTFDDARAKSLAARWRDNNKWAGVFWDKLWAASIHAYRSPGEITVAGRIRYIFLPGLLRGSLVCILPDDRLLVYPEYRRDNYVDPDTGEHKTRTSFKRGFSGGYGRIDLWRGIFAENTTQAVAASFLRLTIVELRDILVLHTHDEVIAEVEDAMVPAIRGTITRIMERGTSWSDGLPLSASIETGPFYTK